MALYPKAEYRPIPSATDTGIVPIGVILHVAASEARSLYDWFNGPSKGIESHFYLRYDGTWEQYRDTGIDADANYMANAFVRDGVRYGFISVETQGLGNGEWSDDQLAEIKEFLAWARDTHGIPLRKCQRWDEAGVGYHTLFPNNWTNVAGKTCPGPKRIVQFDSIIVPWMEGDDMGFTADEVKQLQAFLQGIADFNAAEDQDTSAYGIGRYVAGAIRSNANDDAGIADLLKRVAALEAKPSGSLELKPFTATITPV